MSADAPQMNSQPKKPNTALIVWIVVGVGGLCLLLCAGIFLPALSTARQSIRQIESASQTRLIAQALAMYASENDGELPEVSTGWEQRLIGKGWVTPEILVLPNADAGQVSYIYVPHGKLTADGSTVLVYENPLLNAKLFNVAFDDAHVDAMTRDQLMRIISGLPPVVQPPK